MTLTFFHYQYSYSHYASNSLQMSFHLMLLIGQSHFHGEETLSLAHQHEYQSFLLNISLPLQSIQYASLDDLSPKESPMQSHLPLPLSIKQSRVDLLFSRLLESGHLPLIHQSIVRKVSRILQRHAV